MLTAGIQKRFSKAVMDGWTGGMRQRWRNALLFLITCYIRANILSLLLYKMLSQKAAVNKTAYSSCQGFSRVQDYHRMLMLRKDSVLVIKLSLISLSLYVTPLNKKACPKLSASLQNSHIGWIH